MGFPLAVLRAAIRAYRLPRHLVHQGALSTAIASSRGIVAGCSAATPLVKAYYILPIIGLHQSLRAQLLDVKLQVYLDDFSISTLGSPRQVAKDLVAAGRATIDTITTALFCHVVPEKTVVVASRRSIAVEIAAEIGSGKSTEAVENGVLLGCSLRQGARWRRRGARTTVGKRRFFAAHRRHIRAGIFRRLAGGKGAKLFVSGTRAVGGYGAEVAGIDSTKLKQFRGWAARSFLPSRCSTTAVLLLHGDPTLDMATAATRRYAAEWWNSGWDRSALHRLDLEAMHRAVGSRAPPRSWRGARGPLTAMILELRRLGWSWPAPGVFEDGHGALIHLDQVSPQMLRHLLRASRQEQLAVELGRSTGLEGPVDPAPVRAFLAQRKVDARSKSIVTSLFGGAFLCMDDLAKMDYVVEPICPRCGEPDSAMHRLWACRCDEAVAARSEVDASFLAQVREEPELAVTCLWATTAARNHPPPLEGDLVELGIFKQRVGPGDGEHDWQEVAPRRFDPLAPTLAWASSPGTYRCFLDGALFKEDWPSSARAGWGVVICKGDCPILRAYGPVPGCRVQSAPSAEWCAAEVAASLWSPALPHPLGDCLQVVRAASGCVRARLKQGGFHAALLRRMLSLFGGQMAIEKVKAHRSLSEAVDAQDRETILGNDAADTAAKAGALSHPSPSPAETREAGRRWTFMLDLCKFASRIAAAWPPLRLLIPGGAKRRRKEDGGVASRRQDGVEGKRLSPILPNQQHKFASFGGHIMCGVCLARSHSWAASRRRTLSERCPGSSTAMREALTAVDLGHTLAIGVFQGRATVICIVCGKFATDRVEGLGRPCRAPGQHGRHAINRFFKGRRPDFKKKELCGESFFRVLQGAELEEFTPGGA